MGIKRIQGQLPDSRLFNLRFTMIKNPKRGRAPLAIAFQKSHLPYAWHCPKNVKAGPLWECADGAKR